jgi:hypothetical protein
MAGKCPPYIPTVPQVRGEIGKNRKSKERKEKEKTGDKTRV